MTMIDHRLIPLAIGTYALVGLLGCGSSDSSSANPSTTGPPPESLDDCDPYEEGTNLNICTATYLGSTDGEAKSLAVDDEGDLWMGGNWDGAPAPEFNGDGDGPGYLIRLSPAGGEIIQVMALDAPLKAGAFDSSANHHALVTESHLHLVPTDETSGHAIALEDISQVDADQGYTVVLRDQQWLLFDALGEELTTVTVDRSSVNDVALDGDRELVFITGYHQVSGNLQQPFLFAYDFDGQLQWSNWDWSADEAGELSSDTRGTAISMGLDGKLYYVGESHGGVTTHFRDPQNLEEDAPISRTDPYSESHQWNGAAPLGFVARLDPTTGEMEGAKLLAVRLSDGRGNGVNPRSVTAREDGTIFLAGDSACCIDRWEERTVAGTRAMPEYGGGQWAMVLSADFEERPIWTTFRSTASSVDFGAIAAHRHTFAIALTHRAGSDEDSLSGQMTTANAMVSQAQGDISSPHLSVFLGPP